jgi:hypothetical protein
MKKICKEPTRCITCGDKQIFVFNMQGAIKKLEECSTNKERIEGTCKIAEEFFKTFGIIL